MATSNDQIIVNSGPRIVLGTFLTHYVGKPSTYLNDPFPISSQQMRTHGGDLKQILPSDLYRGIYSLQSLLLLQRSTVTILSCTNAIGVDVFAPIEADSYTLLNTLLVSYAKEKFSRLSINHLVRYVYENRAAASGSDREFATIVKTVDLRNVMLGAISSNWFERVVRIYDESITKNRPYPQTDWHDFIRTASQNGSNRIIECILARMPNLDLTDSLEGAAQGHHLDTVRLLLKTGNLGLEHLKHYGAELIFGDNHLDLIERILDCSQQPFSTRGLNRAIYSAIFKHRAEWVMLILDRAIETQYHFTVGEFVQWVKQADITANSMSNPHSGPRLGLRIIKTTRHPDLIIQPCIPIEIIRPGRVQRNGFIEFLMKKANGPISARNCSFGQRNHPVYYVTSTRFR